MLEFPAVSLRSTPFDVTQEFLQLRDKSECSIVLTHEADIQRRTVPDMSREELADVVPLPIAPSRIVCHCLDFQADDPFGIDDRNLKPGSRRLAEPSTSEHRKRWRPARIEHVHGRHVGSRRVVVREIFGPVEASEPHAEERVVKKIRARAFHEEIHVSRRSGDAVKRQCKAADQRDTESVLLRCAQHDLNRPQESIHHAPLLAFSQMTPHTDERTVVMPRIEPGSWDVHALDIDHAENGEPTLANHRILTSSFAFIEPKGFSQDSRNVVIASSKGSGSGDKSLNADFFSFDLAGNELRRYTWAPTWEEDSDLLRGDGLEGDAAVFISDRDTPNPLQADYSVPAPNDADWIAVASAVVPLAAWTSHELFVAGPEGDRGWIRRLTFDYDKDGWVARNPSWSPDGRRVLFLQKADQGRGGWRRMLLTFDCAGG